MSHWTHFELTGQAYSPVNPNWPTVPVDIQFDLCCGQYTSLPGQVIHEDATNFQMTLGGSQYLVETSGDGTSLLSQNASGIGIQSLNQSFAWEFSGPIWAPGQGAFHNEEFQFNFIFSSITATQYIQLDGSGPTVVLPRVPAGPAYLEAPAAHVHAMPESSGFMFIAALLFAHRQLIGRQ
jgi:hypothetical protein